jgi:murein DD-endopeptidase MepM/ murein hydrolase activator NlpD
MRAFAALLAATGALGLASGARAVELEGTWYVLVHYQDSETSKPDQWRWEDRVWRFARKGDRLEWTEWPIVVLDDESGRFEAQRGGRAARVLGAWEPDASQLADIRGGVQVNSRGSKSKMLLPGPGGASWSSGDAGAAESAAVITYSETWTIAGLPATPVFTRDDSMGGADAEEMSGRTLYESESVGANGDEITGRYDRDGTRKGRFRMIRSSGTEGLKTASKDQEELQRKAGLRALNESPELRSLIREQLEETFAANGTLGSSADVDALVDQAIRELSSGRPPEEISAAIGRKAVESFYAFAEPGAVHDASVRYGLPFEARVPRRLTQGVGGDVAVGAMGVTSTSGFSHKGDRKHAFDFAMPVGTPVLAARDGTVIRVVDHFTEGGPQRSMMGKANVVLVQHADGTWASYAHVSPGALVKQGDAVKAGDVLAKSGNTGYSTAPHLHFEVMRLGDTGAPESVAIRFDDGSPAGFVPVPGSYYGAPGGKASRVEAPPGEAEAATP